MSTPPDYQSPTAARFPRGFDAFAFARHLSGWAAGSVLLLIPCLFILPRYETLLTENKAQVPATTGAAIAAARWLRHSNFIVLVPVGLAHSLAIALWYPRASLPALRLYRVLLTLCAGAVFAFVILALFLPIASITKSFSDKIG